MITYVDTSTLIKLIVDEEGSDRAELIWQSADSVASVRMIVVEARAALAAAARGQRLSTAQFHVAKTELAAFVDDLHLVEVTEELIESAAQLAETESLRGYDAVHLAAAVFVGARGPHERGPSAVRGSRTAGPAHRRPTDDVTSRLIGMDTADVLGRVIAHSRADQRAAYWVQGAEDSERLLVAEGVDCDGIGLSCARPRSGVGAHCKVSCINSCGLFVGVVVLQESTPVVVDPLMTFEQFYADELAVQVRRCFVLTGSNEIANDIVHDAMTEVYRRWPSLDNPGAYLNRAVLNRCSRPWPQAPRRRSIAAHGDRRGTRSTARSNRFSRHGQSVGSASVQPTCRSRAALLRRIDHR